MSETPITLGLAVSSSVIHQQERRDEISLNHTALGQYERQLLHTTLLLRQRKALLVGVVRSVADHMEMMVEAADQIDRLRGAL